MATLLMLSSFILVIIGQLRESVTLALIGVAMGSAQAGLGEASLLASAGMYDNPRSTLTAWSSGTGLAGPFGYAFVILFTMGFEATFATTLIFGLFIPFVYILSFSLVLPSPEERESQFYALAGDDAPEQKHTGKPKGGAAVGEIFSTDDDNDPQDRSLIRRRKIADSIQKAGLNYPSNYSERISAILSLWPFMLPLFAVYLSEYAMQSGAWAAIGIPNVHSADDRKSFYKIANWSYQIGVFFSRSSGTFWPIGYKGLCIMPTLQCLFLAFFWANAAMQWWNDWGLIVPCFVTGLLGGAVYVGAFSLIADEIPKGKHRDFALTSASVADSIGIICADLLGIAIQQQLYNFHHIGARCGQTAPDGTNSTLNRLLRGYE